MAHTPHTSKAGEPLDQATIVKFLVSYITENITEDQQRELTRVFTSFQDSAYHEATAGSSIESKEDLS